MSEARPGGRQQGRRVAGRYQLLEPIGRGGMGIVWRAHDELLDRSVAVKEVRYPGDPDDDEVTELNRRTLREARAAGRLTHPNVVVVHDVIEENGRPWIVMQLVDSRSLGQVLRDDGPLPVRMVAEIGLRVLEALQAAHAAGVMHRDVKPENVLLTHDGRVVLTDFGIARMETDTTMTRTGLVGTPAFIAPERLRGYPAQRESDLWSLGATLYAAVEGRPPHDKGMAMATMHAVLTDEPEPAVRAGRLGPVLSGLLEKDPARRLGADQAERMLRGIAEDRSSAPPPSRATLPSVSLPMPATSPPRKQPRPAPPGGAPAPGAVPPGGPGQAGEAGQGEALKRMRSLRQAPGTPATPEPRQPARKTPKPAGAAPAAGTGARTPAGPPGTGTAAKKREPTGKGGPAEAPATARPPVAVPPAPAKAPGPDTPGEDDAPAPARPAPEEPSEADGPVAMGGGDGAPGDERDGDPAPPGCDRDPAASEEPGTGERPAADGDPADGAVPTADQEASAGHGLAAGAVPEGSPAGSARSDEGDAPGPTIRAAKPASKPRPEGRAPGARSTGEASAPRPGTGDEGTAPETGSARATGPETGAAGPGSGSAASRSAPPGGATAAARPRPRLAAAPVQPVKPARPSAAPVQPVKPAASTGRLAGSAPAKGTAEERPTTIEPAVREDGGPPARVSQPDRRPGPQTRRRPYAGWSRTPAGWAAGSVWGGGPGSGDAGDPAPVTRVRPAASWPPLGMSAGEPPLVPMAPGDLEAAPFADRPLPIVRIVLVTIPLLLIVAGIALWLGLRDAADSTDSARAGAPTVSAVTPSPSAPSAHSSEPAPSSPPPSPASPGPSQTPTPAPTPAASGPAGVPDGWRVYQDRTGFSVALPKKWKVTRRKQDAVWFRGPGSPGFLLIDQTDEPQSDAAKDWREQERTRRHGFPGYKLVRISSVDYWKTAADWEFTYKSSGERVHVVNRGFVTDKRHGYAIYWHTTHKRWTKDLKFLRTFTATFKPDR